MSLVSFATRLAMTRLLVDQTWAGKRVYNAPIDPISVLLGDDGGANVVPRPLIAVYTTDEKQEPEGREVGGRPATIDVAIFAYLPPGEVEIGPEGESLVIDARDAGGAFALDVIWRQCSAALRFGPEAWRKVFEQMVVKVVDVRARPILVELEGGIRLPARETILSLHVIPEPLYGVALRPAWVALDQAMRADPDAAPLADIIAGLITSPQDLPSWRAVQGNRALSEAAIRALGLAPVDLTEAGEAAELDEVLFSGQNTVVGPEGVP